MSLFNSLVPSANGATSRATNNDGATLGPVMKPEYEVKETKEGYGVTVYLPGVTKDGLDLTVENGQISIVGRRAWKQPEGWSSLYRESADATFQLVLTHDNGVDADKAAAQLQDGVLRVSLPKTEAVKPRKIAVN